MLDNIRNAKIIPTTHISSIFKLSLFKYIYIILANSITLIKLFIINNNKSSIKFGLFSNSILFFSYNIGPITGINNKLGILDNISPLIYFFHFLLNSSF